MTNHTTATITCVIELTISREAGPILPKHVAYAQWLLETSIANRVFGQGFLPPDTLVDAYFITSSSPQTA